jgi:cellulose biosynthesis protein BcsQ
MITLALFNHKGGVGKTTLTASLADAFVNSGKKVLLVDTDPQCNLSALFIGEEELDHRFEDSENGGGDTLWSAVQHVVEGSGDIRLIEPYPISDGMNLLVGDVLLAQYEEELPTAWTESFARKPRGYAVMSALSRVARKIGEDLGVDIIMYDVGPNVGPLNRTVILDCDYFATPVHTDLYSLRALTTVGRAVSKWVSDWKIVKSLAAGTVTVLGGMPCYLGYITSQFKPYGGGQVKSHEFFEAQIPSRVKLRVVDVLERVDSSLVFAAPHKLGQVPHFQSLASMSQRASMPIGKLKGHVPGGHATRADNASQIFSEIGKTILKKTRLS